MAQDINLRRLVIKSFHIDTVEWATTTTLPLTAR